MKKQNKKIINKKEKNKTQKVKVKKAKEIKRENYNPEKIENKWIKIWDKQKTYKTKIDLKKKKMHVLDMFPYPSGEGLHTGHAKTFGGSDYYARFKRMQGYNVLHATGWDAFGLPAEQYAIKNKINPKISTKKNTDNFKKQMMRLGLSYDWDRMVNTSDPDFYKWTQFIFKELYKAGLCHESFEPINWCPSCKTGLANEDLEDGKCERCGSVVEKKPIRQWVVKITDYAEKLLSGLNEVNWKENIKEMQRNWIGKSEGAEIDFSLIPSSSSEKGVEQVFKFTIFTTRPDTLFGCTYCVFAPESKLVEELLNKNIITNKKEVQKYIEETKSKSEIERSAVGREKTGIKLEGVIAINPVNQKKVPVYIADYVLGNYGTGAIMAVPAHDERDYEFAKKYNIEIIQVVRPIRIDKNNPHKDGYEIVKRDMVHGIIYDPKEKKYLMLHWKSNPWTTFVLGGAEENEDHFESVKREIEEETGFTNLKFLYKSISAYSEYCAHHKKQNRIAHTTAYFFELDENTLQNKISEEENSKHTLEWIDLEKGLPKNFTCSEWDIFKETIKFKGLYPNSEYGKLMNSGEFDGMNSEEAKKKITEFVGGKMVTKYKLKDWVFARQRYWGEPFPIVFKNDEKGNRKSFVVADKCLPVLLPDVKSYEPTGDGESPLKNIKDWVNVYGFINKQNEFEEVKLNAKQKKDLEKNFKKGINFIKIGKNKIEKFERETNTMPQWAGSSWYWLRYMDPKNKKSLVDKKVEKYWGQVDIYMGGLEHATRHLIYGRFWNRFLYDRKLISTKEPFYRLEANGMVLAEGGVKMSKRLGNIINPDDIVNQFGADTLRLYTAFAAGYGDNFAWDTRSIVGPRRFIEKVWAMQYKLSPIINPSISEKEVMQSNIETILHQTIKKVSEDYEKLSFNTAVAQMMILGNVFEKLEKINIEDYKTLLKLLAPISPFVTEEIWNNLSSIDKKDKELKNSIHHSSWPKYNEKKTVNKNITFAIQINGKVRGEFPAQVDMKDEDVINLCKNTETYKKWVTEVNVEPRKIIVVKNKLVNIVV